MKKYNFHELKEAWKKPLPEDVNKFLDDFANVIKSEDLQNRLKRLREKKLFGTLRVFDALHLEIFKASFRYGMCNKADLSDLEGYLPKAPFLILFNRSLFNSNLEMSKEVTN